MKIERENEQQPKRLPPAEQPPDQRVHRGAVVYCNRSGGVAQPVVHGRCAGCGAEVKVVE